MTRSTPTERTPRTGAGFTLVETVVVVSLISLVSVALAASFTVIVRTAPVAQDRADDSRALLGLTNWLPQDVASTDETGFVAGDTTSSCAGTSGQGLLELTWTIGSNTHVANYRFVDGAPGSGEIVRYSCINGQVATELSLSSPLATITGAHSGSPAPVDVNLLPAIGDRPPGVQFDVIIVDEDGVTQRDLLSLDAYTTNVHTTLPPTTTTVPSGSNQPPLAADLYIEGPLDTEIEITLPAVDNDGDTLTATFDPPPPEVSAWDLAGPGDLTGKIEARSADGAIDGATYSFGYEVDDGVNPPVSAAIHFTVNGGVSPATTSTSTTTPACVADFVSLSPDPSTVKNSGHLADDLVVTITHNGWCIPLVLEFTPDPGLPTQQLPFGGSLTLTIPKNAYAWDKTATSFLFELKQGAGGPVEDTGTLGVT